MKYIYSTIKNIYNISELRNRIGITIILLLIYRFGSYVPLPGINPNGYSSYASYSGIMQILSSFTGGAFNRVSVLALSVMPYISASIIVQLMSFAFSYFQKIQKDGESGNRKMNYIIKWVTILVCLIQAPAYIIALTTHFIPLYTNEIYFIYNNKLLFIIISVIILTTGTLFTVWLGDKITQKGIGNGISLIIMTGIISRFPISVINEINNKMGMGIGKWNYGLIFLEFLLWILVIIFCLLVIQAVRKIPIRYVNSYYSNNIFQHIPIKVTTAGVMPIIFSQSIMLFPMTISTYIKNEKIKYILDIFNNIYGFWYNLIFVIMIIIFTFFYTSLTISVSKISDDLKRNGGYIPNVKPGKNTINYLDNIIYKITIPGALLLSIIAILPSLVIKIGITKNIALFYGGTSLLIIIGVIFETIQQINIYLLNYKYDHFIYG
ncbi:MAG: preprotein translocase subunit SecY [Candidatus Bostrichicola ureolyticus]|nr:MAG: preprotein translocase subunit SecY [Candidatus Bostrichicola ureolyticus]